MCSVWIDDNMSWVGRVFHNLLLYPIILRKNDIIISIYIICGAYNL
jgi:hypothetical protein